MFEHPFACVRCFRACPLWPLAQRAAVGHPCRFCFHHADGHYLLGLLYYYGDGVEESKPRALAFFKEAARLGHAHAHVNAGHMLEHGVATSADATAAYAFYRQAAVRWRDVEACVRAAALLYEGRVSAQIASWEQGMRTAKEASCTHSTVAAEHGGAERCVLYCSRRGHALGMSGGTAACCGGITVGT